jgi:hypothetical protein
MMFIINAAIATVKYNIGLFDDKVPLLAVAVVVVSPES